MPKPKSPRSNLQNLDEATASCRKIAALAELLAHCEVERLEPQTISLSGALIVDEVKNVCHHLKILASQQ